MREPIRDPEIRRRFREVMDLYSSAETAARMHLRRRHPQADDDEIERKLALATGRA